MRRQGEDLRRLTAATMLRVDPKKVTVERRKHAKPVNFGRLYGQGAAGLGEAALAITTLFSIARRPKNGSAPFGRPIPTTRDGAAASQMTASAAGEIAIGRDGGRVHEIHWTRKATATRSASICRSKASAPTSPCWPWR